MNGVVTSEIDGVTHRGTARNEQRMVVEIETDLVGGFSVAGQYVEAPYPKQGEPRKPHKQAIVIFESEWPQVQKLVRTDEHIKAWDMACAMARSKADAAVAKETNAIKREEIRGKELIERMERLHEMPAAKGGIPPLLSARIVKRDCAPPPTAQNVSANQTRDLAEVLRTLLLERETAPRKRDKNDAG